MDEGDILAVEEWPLSGRETAESLSATAAECAARIVPPVLDAIEAGKAEARPQPSEGVSYCSLIKKEDGLIDWSRDALDLGAMVRAYFPWPLAYTSLAGSRLLVHEALPLPEAAPPPSGDKPAPAPGTVLRVDRSEGILVQTGRGRLALLRLQLEGEREMDGDEFTSIHDIEHEILGGDA